MDVQVPGLLIIRKPQMTDWNSYDGVYGFRISATTSYGGAPSAAYLTGTSEGVRGGSLTPAIVTVRAASACLRS
jgi:hypothetical protein